MRTICRSLLFVSAHQPDRIHKACASGADAVVIDLEDAVPLDRKDEARAHLADWLAAAAHQADGPALAVRINPIDTPWHASDTVLAAHPLFSAVMLPKAQDAGALRSLALACPQAALWPLVETARGFSALDALAAVPNVQRLVFGSIDFQADLGIDGDADELLFFRSRLVLVSRLAQLQPPVDGVSTVLGDADRLCCEATRARRLGFGGKLCIHPQQVALVNNCFTPSVAQIDWARRVIAADAASGGAPVAVDGKMVDRPVVLQAQAMLRALG